MDIVSLLLSKKYVEDSLTGAGAIQGKSAYEVAQANGFTGSEKDWLTSLNGVTPHIGENGNWFIGDTDCGVVASPSLAGFATEEFVNAEIAKINLSPYATKQELNAAIGKIIIPDVSGFIKAEEVDQKIAEIPTPDLTNYAKKNEIPDVSNFITEEDLPSLDNYATQDFVSQKINEAQLADKDVDLSAYYTKTEVDKKLQDIEHPTPNLEGYATEEYVQEALSNLEVKQATVYETASDETDLDKILPTDVEFVSGDMFIVTNSMGEKSAYCYNGENWIACDGNIDASKVIMPIDITLAGSYTQVGNLTKSSTGTAKFATKGKSVAATLQEMLSKREQPGSPSRPSINCSASGMSAVEVGTTVTPGWSVSLNSGSYTYGPATGIKPTKWTITDNKGNTSENASGNFPSFKVTDSDNYSYTVSVTHEAGAIAYDNLGEQSNPVVRIAANSASAVSRSGLKGYRQWFVYVGTNNSDAIDSKFIRSSSEKGNAASASTINNLAIPAGTKRVMVAIPQALTGAQYSYGKSLKSVIDVDGMGLDVFVNFSKSEVMVEGKDGATAVKYNVWFCENANGLAATKYNLVIG